MTKDLQAVAEEYTSTCQWQEFLYESKKDMPTEVQRQRPSDIPTNIANSFKAGALWAIKHSPEVLALVEAIKLSVARADDYGDSHLSQPIRQVLTAYRKSVEEE